MVFPFLVAFHFFVNFFFFIYMILPEYFLNKATAFHRVYPLPSCSVKHNNLGLIRPNALHMQFIASKYILDERAIALEKLSIFSPVQPNFCLAAFTHAQMNKHLSFVLLRSLGAHDPLELVLGRNDTCPHDKIGMYRNRVGNDSFRVFLLLSGSVLAAFKWTQNLYEFLALVLFLEVKGMVTRLQSLLPRDRPNLQKVPSFRLVLVEF